MAHWSTKWMLAVVSSTLLTGPGGAAELPTFTDVTRQVGIQFKHSYGDLELDNIVESTGTGACMFDYDNDGFQDLYFVNGAWTRWCEQIIEARSPPRQVASQPVSTATRATVRLTDLTERNRHRCSKDLLHRMLGGGLRQRRRRRPLRH